MYDLSSKYNFLRPACALALGTVLALGQVAPSFATSSTAIDKVGEGNLGLVDLESGPLISPSRMDDGSGTDLNQQLFGLPKLSGEEVDTAGVVFGILLGARVALKSVLGIEGITRSNEKQLAIMKEATAACRKGTHGVGSVCTSHPSKCDDPLKLKITQKVHTGKYYEYFRVKPLNRCRESDGDCSFSGSSGHCAPVDWISTRDHWDFKFPK